MQRLLAEAAFVAQESQHEQRQTLWQILILARWRMYLLGPLFWIAGVFLLLIGSVWLAPLVPYISVTSLVTLLILLLPLTAVLILAHALRTPSAGLRAIEASCPASFVQTSLGLALAILAFDSLLGLVATLIFALMHFAPFWSLLVSWLAPLLLLTAISLPIALLRGARLAALIGGLPWLFLGFIALLEQHTSNIVTTIFSLPQDTLSLVSHLAAIVLSLLLLAALFTSAPKWQRYCSF